jgi:hypothetical protein
MSTDTELESWRTQWQSSGGDAKSARAVAELRLRTLRQSRLQRIGLIAPVLVTVFVGGGMVLGALASDQLIDFALAVECWLFIGVAWAGSMWIARGTWKPLGETTADFLQLSIRRCEANIRGAVFGVALYIGQLIAVLTVSGQFGSSPEVIESVTRDYRVVGAFLLGLIAMSLWSLWFAARQRKRLAGLRQLEAELRDTDAL